MPQRSKYQTGNVDDCIEVETQLLRPGCEKCQEEQCSSGECGEGFREDRHNGCLDNGEEAFRG